MILRKDMFSGGMFVMEDYLLPEGMNTDLKKFLCRDDSQRRNASGFDEIPGTQNAAVSAGQNSISRPEQHPQLPGPQVSETEHNTAASFPKQNTIAFRSRCFNHNHK